MKTKLLLLVALILFPVLSFAEEVTVTVNGMVCSFCAQGIKKTFESKEAVETVFVDLDKKLVVVNIKTGQSIPDAEITKGINDAGFDVVNISRKDDNV